MLARPMQEIRIKGIQDRRSTKQARRPWIVRLTIDGRERSKSFRTRAEADRYRVLLLQAAQAGERFDSVSGEPCAWRESMRDWPVHRWVRHWVSEQWPEWQPRTRASALEALARFVSLAVSDDARVPTDLRRYLERTLAASDANQLDDALEEWLDSHALSLMECTRDVLVGIDRRLALRLDGEFLASSTAKRYRNVARACLRGAVSAGAIDADPWPAWSRARAQRKVVRARGTINVRSLPEPSTMARAIDAIETHQPGSKTYKVMTAVAYYAGLRPSEVVMLRRRSLHLEGSGWGALEVTEADISYDEPGEPKTGSRTVPVPAHPRRDAETVDRSERGPRARGLGLSNKVGTTTLALELVARLATCAYVDRRTAIEGLRLPPRLRNHVAPSRCTAGRDRTTSRTPSRHVGVDLRGST